VGHGVEPADAEVGERLGVLAVRGPKLADRGEEALPRGDHVVAADRVGVAERAVDRRLRQRVLQPVRDEGHGLDHEALIGIGPAAGGGVELGLEPVGQVVAGIENEVRARQQAHRRLERRAHQRVVGVAAVLGEALLLGALEDGAPAVDVRGDQVIDDRRVRERIEMDVRDDQEHTLIRCGREGQGLRAEIGRTGAERQQHRSSGREGACDSNVAARHFGRSIEHSQHRPPPGGPNAGAGASRLRRASHQVQSEPASQVEERQHRPAARRGLALVSLLAIVWFRFEVGPARRRCRGEPARAR
jgi:hypothetical protein